MAEAIDLFLHATANGLFEMDWLLVCPPVRLRRREQLRAPRERPRSRRTAEQRDELASLQLIELHVVPRKHQGRIAGYRTGGD
jgi:hypothetical protein